MRSENFWMITLKREAIDLLTFGTKFLICNLSLTFIIGLILFIKKILRNFLTERTQYHLWFLLFVLLVIPFVPVPLPTLTIFMHYVTPRETTNFPNVTDTLQMLSPEQINDFAVSVSSQTPSFLNYFILSVWITGMILMTVFMVRSWQRFHTMEKSALPLQTEDIHTIYKKCLSEMGIKKSIPIYSTIFLNSPVTTGLLHPRIYLPISLVSDFDEADIRFMLLHELHHYRHKDALINHLINLANVVYWFHPLVWYALREIKCDHEIACDASVLQMLHESDYKDYGKTVLHFAEKLSFPSFASGIGGRKKQTVRRIQNIAHFQKRSISTKVQSIFISLLITALFLGFVPFLSTYAVDANEYSFDKTGKNLLSLDLSSTFSGYNGAFVLYDSAQNTWSIYNEKQAALRVSPASTYKIYDGLLGLENKIITPTRSILTWNGEDYPFAAWKTDHDLTSAMQNSVNWYFQTIDASVGKENVKAFLEEIDYGNQNIGNDLALYWTDSSLKISPLEQVELLEKFYNNDFLFSDEHILAVKHAIHLSTTDSGSLYGKTGTERVDGNDVCGWFVGYVETAENIYYFATNIQGEADTTGSLAADITMSVLSELNIYK